MRGTLKRAFRLLVAARGGWAAAAEPLRPVMNLELPRKGALEQGSEERGPKGWSARPDPPEGARLTWETDSGRAGTRCLAIRSRYEEDRPWFRWQQDLPLQGGSTVEVSAWVRTTDLRRGAVMVLTCLDGNRKQIARPHIPLPPHTAGTCGNLRKRLVLPAGTERGRLQLSMHGKGSLRMDDLGLKRLPQPEVTPFSATKVYPAMRSPRPVSVDGRTEDWEGTPFAHVWHAYQVSEAEAAIMDQEESRGSSDLGFSYAVRYDGERLFLVFDVRDDVRRTAEPYWRGDGLQFALDTGFRRSRSGYGPGVYAFGIRLDGDAARAVIEHKPSGSRVAAADVRVATKAGRGGTSSKLQSPGRPWGSPAPPPTRPWASRSW